jgi:hypothetical protein
MKKITLLLLLFLSLGCLAHAQQSAQATFDEANTLFENGELTEAMNLYKSIAASSKISGALFLNMGITAVQIDSLGLAKFYFLKAQDFETIEAQTNTALEYVNGQFSRQSATLPKLPWDRAVQWINDVITASGLFLFGFLITVAGLALLFLSWFGKLPLQKVYSPMLSLILVGLVMASLAFYADYVNQRYDGAVLITDSQRVLQSPNTEATLESIAYEGYDLTIDHWKSEEQPGWLYIRLGNGQFGWMKNEGVKVL